MGFDLQCRRSGHVFLLTVFLVFVSSATGKSEEQAIHLTAESALHSLQPQDSMWFEPQHLKKIIEGEVHTVTWYTDVPGEVVAFDAVVDDKMVADVHGVSPTFRGLATDNYTAYGYVNISADFIGYNSLTIVVLDEYGKELANGKIQISVLLAYQNLNDIFTLAIGVLVALVYINMGATLDLQVIKQIVKKPVGPAVGIFCQYLVMPVIAFGLGKLAFDDMLLQLGMFLNGTSPGGGASNMWTHLLGGSLDLSIMMTFCSTLSAFAFNIMMFITGLDFKGDCFYTSEEKTNILQIMKRQKAHKARSASAACSILIIYNITAAVPLWIFTLGRVIVGDAEFVIPYVDITVLIISLIVPCGFGLLLQKYFPRLAKFLGKLLTPMSLFNLIFIFTFGVYANRYVFSIFDWKILIAGFGLPTLGYLSGMALGLMCRLPRKDVIAISIETGIQNASVALFILKFTLEKPAGDLTAVVPCASVIMTPLPLLTALACKKMYDWRCRRSSCNVTQQKETSHLNGTLEERKATSNGDIIMKKDIIKSNPQENPATGGVDNVAADLQDAVV